MANPASDSSEGIEFMSGASVRRGASKRYVAAAIVATMSLAVSAHSALAATTASGTSTVSFSGGALTLGSVLNQTINEGIGTTGNGILPEALWQDPTGSGKGWNGTVAVSDLTFTSAWQAQGSAGALATATSGAFNDTADGVEYLVSVGSGGNTATTPLTWTSTGGADTSSGGTISATNGTPFAIGTKGVTITFASATTYTSGWQYLILVGTQTSTAMSIDTAATGALITSVAGSGPQPTFQNNTATVPGGGVGSSAYGAGVKFLSAALGRGNGKYTVDPGVQVVSDTNTWAGNYTAGVQYTIAQGP